MDTDYRAIENGKNRPTMQDVASVAGVSLKTVSRVVNNEPRVNEETRQRVHEAIESLGFRRNDIARSLRRGQTSATIGLIIEDISNPFYSQIARGIEKVAQDYHYMVIISNSEENPAREQELANALFRRRAEGLLIVPAGGDNHAYLQQEMDRGTPIIFLDRPPVNLATDMILLDNRGGARAGVEHLLSYGHRRIAMISGDPKVHTGAERLIGYHKALAAWGVPFEQDLLCFNRDDPERAEAAVHELLALEQPPTAIFTSNNRISIAVLRALRSYPQRIAFTGFDDFELAEMLPLPATVVAHDTNEMGRIAAELLFARLQHDEGPIQKIIMPTRLIVRGSGEFAPN